MRSHKPNQVICVWEDSSLASILETFAKEGVKPEDFKDFNLEHDWGGCYYEGDTPSIVFVESDERYKRRTVTGIKNGA